MLTYFMHIRQFSLKTKIPCTDCVRYVHVGYDMLISAFFLLLFHFLLEKIDRYIPLQFMSSGLFRVVPLIKIFIFIQNVISMKLQKESHRAVLAVKMWNKQLKICLLPF